LIVHTSCSRKDCFGIVYYQISFVRYLFASRTSSLCLFVSIDRPTNLTSRIDRSCRLPVRTGTGRYCTPCEWMRAVEIPASTRKPNRKAIEKRVVLILKIDTVDVKAESIDEVAKSRISVLFTHKIESIGLDRLRTTFRIPITSKHCT
jgi:hypothetical protein